MSNEHLATVAASGQASSLASEVDSILSANATEGATAPSGDGGAELAAPIGAISAEAWAPFLHVAVKPMLFGQLIPQWGVPPEESNELVDAMGACLDQVFPGGPDGKYACWVRFIFGSVMMVALRVNIEVKDGQRKISLPPMGPKWLSDLKAQHQREQMKNVSPTAQPAAVATSAPTGTNGAAKPAKEPELTDAEKLRRAIEGS